MGIINEKIDLYRKLKDGNKGQKTVKVYPKLTRLLSKRLQLHICQCIMGKHEGKPAKIIQIFKLFLEQ